MLTLSYTQANAFPAFAAREMKACGHCHLSPTGGGPRNSTGQRYAANGYSFPVAGANEVGTTMSPAASHESVWDRVSVSGTLVMAYTLTQGPGGEPSCNACHSEARVPDNRLLLMSGQVQVAARVTDRLSVVASTDLGEPREIYAAYAIAPGRVHTKAGLFVVPFGLKKRDHNSFVDAKFNVGSNRRDIGIAASGILGIGFWETSVTGGGTLEPLSPPIRVFSGENPTVTATLGANFGPVRTGASFLRGQSSFADRYDVPDAVFRPLENPNGYLQMRYGAFASYTRSLLTVAGEIVYGTDEETRTPTAGDPRETYPRLGSYLSLKIAPIKWLAAGATYEFFDPSRDHADDALTHYTGFAEVRVSGNVMLHARYRVRRESSAAEISNDDFMLILRIDA